MSNLPLEVKKYIESNEVLYYMFRTRKLSIELIQSNNKDSQYQNIALIRGLGEIELFDYVYCNYKMG